MDELTRANWERWNAPTKSGETLMQKFWRRMAEAYRGVGWYDAYGRDIPEAWQLVLQSMTPEEAAAGYRELLQTEHYGLPSLATFTQATFHAMRKNRPVAPVVRKLSEPESKRTERMQTGAEHMKSAKETLKAAGAKRRPRPGMTIEQEAEGNEAEK